MLNRVNYSDARWDIVSNAVNIMKEGFKRKKYDYWEEYGWRNLLDRSNKVFGKDKLMETTVKKEKLIEILKANKENHAKIVEEAKLGYVENAKRVLLDRLESLKRDDAHKKGISIYINLPEDHTKDYQTLITMMEMNVEDEIKLDSNQFRNFVLDDWQWTNNFYTTNAIYSASALTGCLNRGIPLI